VGQAVSSSYGAEGCLMYGAASISRAWLPEMLLVHEERGSVVGV